MLAELARRARDLGPALKNIGEELLDSTRERFHRERDPKGRPWTPNAPSTLERKRNPKILQEFGERGGLLGSLNYRVRGQTLTLGTPKPYGAIHQLSGKAGRGLKIHIPARPYLGISREDEAAIRDVLADHLDMG